MSGEILLLKRFVSMLLTVDRAWPKKAYTIGKLFIDGVRFCETLEDTERGLRQSMPLSSIKALKRYGRTAIPKGIYGVRMTYSGKFAKKSWAKPTDGMVPEIVDVPGFSGVRIHPGNTAEDTLGCILVGRNTEVGKVTDSQAAYRNLVDNYIVPALKRDEQVTLIIR